jgi:hypothetical protein
LIIVKLVPEPAPFEAIVPARRKRRLTAASLRSADATDAATADAVEMLVATTLWLALFRPAWRVQL